MTLTDVETAIRQDLNDSDAGSYRWPAAVLDRCIARAVKEYSFVWPRLQGIVVPVTAGLRVYPQPGPSSLAAPGTPALTPQPSGGALAAGELYVRVTAGSGSSESAPSAEASIAVAAGGSVSVQTAAVAGAQYYHIYAGSSPGAEMWNGFTTSLSYSLTALSPLTGALAPLKLSEPVASVQAWWVEEIEFPVGMWPPRNVPFEEQGGLIVLDLPRSLAPGSGSTVMNLIYAAIHQLDGAGCTLPDQDTDVIALGAYGYACLQYGTPAADNFKFQDGEMRDMLDDSMVAGMWAKLGQDALAHYRQRLAEIRQRRDYQAVAIVHWGDVPRRWDRL